MDLKYIKLRLDNIEKSKGDYESAHGLEDNLYQKFVEHVSTTDGDLGVMAKEILKSKEIDFPRYCA